MRWLGTRTWRFRQTISTTASAYTDAYTEHQGATYDDDTYVAGANLGVGRRTGMGVVGGANTIWAYDARGQVTSTHDRAPGMVVGREFTQTYALTGAGTNSYCYDRTGNLVSGAGRSYLWTATNMP